MAWRGCQQILIQTKLVNTYLKANYAVTEAINLYGDVQYRYINYQTYGTSDRWDWMNNQMQVLNVNEDFHFFNPKAGIFYAIDEQNSAYASVAVGHREPTRNNYKDAELTANPTFERLINYELGYSYKHATYAFGANAYYMDYKNQLVLTGKVNEIGEALTSNTPESYRMGIELTAGVQITPWLQWNGNLTVSENINKKVYRGVQKNRCRMCLLWQRWIFNRPPTRQKERWG